MGLSAGGLVDENTKQEFGKELNKGVGELLCSLRIRAGFSFEQVATAIAEARLERIKRLEAGDISPRGQDLIELISVYGVDPGEIQISIQTIAANARAKAQADSPPTGPHI